MTNNQVQYLRYKEDARHNLFSERENKRHNVAQEGIDVSKAILDAKTKKYSADTSYAASIYGSDTNLIGTRYSADSHLIGTKYSADTSKAASDYRADRSYASSIYSADRSYQASKYSADKNYASSIYSADTKYASSIYSADKKYAADITSTLSQAQSKRYDVDRRLEDNARERDWKATQNYEDRKQKDRFKDFDNAHWMTETMLNSVFKIVDQENTAIGNVAKLIGPIMGAMG